MTRRQFISKTVAFGAISALSASATTPPRARPLGVALVGLGSYSTRQLGPALRLTKHCRLAGVVTGDAAKGVRWAQEYGFSEKNIWSYDSMARLADCPEIDIVYVVTPNGLHAERAIAAAKAGKHVICEKPMANTVAECDQIIAACRAAGVKLSIGYRLHFDPLHEELRRLVRTREFGPFLKMDGAFAFSMTKPQWRATKALAGGGPMMDVGIYVLQESLMATTAMPVAVSARAHEKRRPEFFVDVEEALEWTLEFADGAKCTGFTSYDESLNYFRAEAQGGWFELKPAYSYTGVKANSSRGPLSIVPPASQQALQMDDFAVCVRDGLETRVPGEMGRRDMVIVEAIYASVAAGGKRMEIRL